MKRQTGIWLDLNGADIIHLEKGKASIERIESNIEDFHLKGGARSKLPYGPMDKTSETKLLERRKHQSANYFKELTKVLKESDELFIMGPAEAKIGYREYLKKVNILRPKLLDVQSADSMTMNQKIATVKEFYQY